MSWFSIAAAIAAVWFVTRVVGRRKDGKRRPFGALGVIALLVVGGLLIRSRLASDHVDVHIHDVFAQHDGAARIWEQRHGGGRFPVVRESDLRYVRIKRDAPAEIIVAEVEAPQAPAQAPSPAPAAPPAPAAAAPPVVAAEAPAPPAPPAPADADLARAADEARSIVKEAARVAERLIHEGVRRAVAEVEKERRSSQTLRAERSTPVGKIAVKPVVKVAPQAPQVKVFAERPAADGPPAWVTKPAARDRDVYHAKATAGPWKTRRECDEDLPRELAAVVQAYVDSYLGAGASGRFAVPPAFIQERIVKETYEEPVETSVGQMINLHAKMEFDRRVRADLHRMWRDAQIRERLMAIGVGSGLVFVFLGTLFGYLKLDTLTRGYYTRRLQFAAATVILAEVAVVATLLAEGLP